MTFLNQECYISFLIRRSKTIIAFYVDRFSPGAVGGVQAYLRRISMALQQHGLESVLLTQKTARHRSDEETIDGLRVFRFDCGDLVDRLTEFSLAPQAERAALASKLFKKHDIEDAALQLSKGLFAFIRDYKPRVIHFHNSFSLAPFALYFLKQNHPMDYPPAYYFWSHSPQKSLTYPDGSVNNLYHILSSFQNMFKAIFSVSHYVNTLMVKAGINSKVRYLGVDPAIFQKRAEVQLDVREKFGLSPQSQLLLYTGRLIREKGLDLLPAILNQLRHRDSAFANYHFLIVGDGPYQESLRALAREDDLEAAFHFLKAEDDEQLVECYSQANCFLLPSRREAFGLSLIEAMSCSLPCLSTDLPGAKEIITHTLNGILVKKDDINDFVRWLSSIHFNGELRSSMGRAARETIEQKFNFKDHVNYFLKRLVK